MITESVLDVLQIVFADIVLSGDNALVIGMAAAGLSPKLRKRAIFIGMMAAAGLRIIFAVIASYLLAIDGILLIGGALLAWVCWRFYNDLKEFKWTFGTFQTFQSFKHFGKSNNRPPPGL